MLKPRLLFPLTSPFFLGVTLFFLGIGPLGVWVRAADGEARHPTGINYPTFATPALLAAAPASDLTSGAQALVTNQGFWNYTAACPVLCDGGDTCRTVSASDGGSSCWTRATTGVPGAQNQVAWYVDGLLGSNASSCLGAGSDACADPFEILRRVGPQPIQGSVAIYVGNGDFSSMGETFSVTTAVPGVSVSVFGTRTFTTADGGDLGTWIVTEAQAWDADAGLEPILTVANIDGGAGFPFTTSGDGVWLEDETGTNVGLAVPVFAAVDAGADGGSSFRTSGGAFAGNYQQGQPVVGDVLKAYTITKIGTASGVYTSILNGSWYFQDIDLGSSNHSLNVTMPNGPGGVGAIEFDACHVRGLNLFGGWLYAYGSSFDQGARIYTYAAFLTANQFDLLESRANGYVELSGWNLAGNPFGVGGFSSGGAGAGAFAFNTGPNAAIGIGTTAGLWVQPGGSAVVNSPFWIRDSGATGVAIAAVSGSLGVTYATGLAPRAVGVSSPTPWLIGGTSYATLPQTNAGASVQPYTPFTP